MAAVAAIQRRRKSLYVGSKTLHGETRGGGVIVSAQKVFLFVCSRIML